jgi:SRSO17 transposase
LATRAWCTGCTNGSKSPRIHDWCAARFGLPTEKRQQRWLLIRRHPGSGELAYFLCCAPPEVTALDLARAAGRRWSIEVCFELAKQQTGLDGYEVRSWNGWH